jgi:tetratricopeptide (TPR) repeat protein
LAEESGDVFSRSTAHATHGWSCSSRGFLEEAKRHFLKGFELAQFMPYLWYAQMEILLGTTYSELGDFTGSKAAYERGISVLADNELQPSMLASARVGRLRAAAMNGERDLVLESLPLLPKTVKMRSIEGWFYVQLGETYLYLDDLHFSEAEDRFLKAIETSERNGARSTLGQAHRSYAELFRRKGDRVKAREHLDKAIEIMKQCGADGWVAKYEQELAALS